MQYITTIPMRTTEIKNEVYDRSHNIVRQKAQVLISS